MMEKSTTLPNHNPDLYVIRYTVGEKKFNYWLVPIVAWSLPDVDLWNPGLDYDFEHGYARPVTAGQTECWRFSKDEHFGDAFYSHTVYDKAQDLVHEYDNDPVSLDEYLAATVIGENALIRSGEGV